MMHSAKNWQGRYNSQLPFFLRLMLHNISIFNWNFSDFVFYFKCLGFFPQYLIFILSHPFKVAQERSLNLKIKWTWPILLAMTLQPPHNLELWVLMYKFCCTYPCINIIYVDEYLHWYIYVLLATPLCKRYTLLIHIFFL